MSKYAAQLIQCSDHGGLLSYTGGCPICDLELRARLVAPMEIPGTPDDYRFAAGMLREVEKFARAFPQGPAPYINRLAFAARRCDELAEFLTDAERKYAKP